MEHLPRPLQRAAHGWLAEQQPDCGSCAVPFFRENREDDQQIEICRPPPPQYLLSISLSGGFRRGDLASGEAYSTAVCRRALQGNVTKSG
jgi:hypothetical protein